MSEISPWGEYPEHDKLHNVAKLSQICGEFVVWLKREKGIELAEWGRQHKEDHLFPAATPMTALLAEYFKIDPEKLEREKSEMLEAFRHP